jgi:DNA polymerase-3 subunit alpha
MDAIRQNISHTAAELVETQNQQIVRVAGLITRIRPHTTKKGDPMAFVTIEDIQGVIELVIFPRTYGKYHEILQWDNIIMVDGKVDARGSEPKVLVDHITTELDHVKPLKILDHQESVTRPQRQTKVPKPEITEAKDPGSLNEADLIPTSTPKQILEPTPPFQPDWTYDEISPLPDEFPIGWEEANGVVLEMVEPGNSTKPITEVSTPDEEINKTATVDAPLPDSELTLETIKGGMDKETPAKTSSVSPNPPSEIGADQIGDHIISIEPPLTQVDAPEKIFQPILPPITAVTSDDVHMITVILRPKVDKARNKLLLRRIFGIMISQPGNDRFAFHIFEKGTGHLLEFPNLTTRLCPELINQINILVGSDNVRVEPITFQ